MRSRGEGGCLAVLLFAGLAQAQTAPEPVVVPWPAPTKAVAVAGCRQQITQSAERDYRLRHNLPEFSPERRAQLQRALDPITTAACSCVLDRLEKEFSFEQFATSPAVQARMQQLVAAECSLARLMPKGMTPPLPPNNGGGTPGAI